MNYSAKYLLKKVTKDVADSQRENMFMTETQQLDETQFHKNGKICPYYIVGKPEIFDNANHVVKETEQSNLPTKPSQRIIKQQAIKKDTNFIYEDLDGSDVEREINLAIQREHQKEQGIKMTLTKPDQMYEEKQQKIMVSFQNQQQQWQKRVIQSAKACGRDPKHSLFHHIDAARQRYEDRKLLDLIQNDADKYGNKLWELQLRAPQGELNNKNEKACFEIVRKNRAEQVYERPQGIQNKFQEKKHIIEQIIPTLSVQEMEVVGQNQLKRESASLQNLIKNSKFQKKIPLTTTSIPLSSKRRRTLITAPFCKQKQIEEPLYYQQVIEMNYDKRLLRQTGQLDIFKQVF